MNVLQIGWASLNPINVSRDETVLLIHARLTNEFPISNFQFPISNIEQRMRFTLNDNPLSELADGEGNVIHDAKLSIADAGIATSVMQNNMVRIYPNPTSDMLNIEYIMEREGTCSAELVNLTSVVVAKTYKEDNKAGLNKMIMNLRDVPNGAYMLKVILEDHAELRKVIVNR